LAKITIGVGLLSPSKLASEKPNEAAPAAAESVERRGRLCYEGEHVGVNGPVKVTAELLKLMAERYNRVKGNPQNEHDYAPILVEHVWSADSIKGRLLAGLELGSWLEPASGKEVVTIEGTLRIDDEAAQGDVAKGKYNHLSLTFDDETGEIFEISFVAVEAARGAQLLKKGDTKMNYEQLFKSLSAKNKEKRAIRAASLSAIKQTATAHTTDVATLVDGVAKLKKATRVVALTAQLRGLVRAGKLTPAAFGKIKVEELAALSPEGQKAVLSAYDSAAVSTDFVQHGQAGAKPITKAALTPAQLRKAIKEQQLGKKAPLAAEGQEESQEEKERREAEALAAEGEGQESEATQEGNKSELKLEDMEEVLKALEAFGPMIEKLTGYVQQMGSQVDQLSADNEKVEGEEE
jgi:hypothetical protein